MILGALFFGERFSLNKLAGIAMIIGGVIGLRLSGAA